MKIILKILGWIFNPISSSLEIRISDKPSKGFKSHFFLIFLTSLILTSLIVLGIYYL